jgi:hypothetical protein
MASPRVLNAWNQRSQAQCDDGVVKLSLNFAYPMLTSAFVKSSARTGGHACCLNGWVYVINIFPLAPAPRMTVHYINICRPSRQQPGRATIQFRQQHHAHFTWVSAVVLLACLAWHCCKALIECDSISLYACASSHCDALRCRRLAAGQQLAALGTCKPAHAGSELDTRCQIHTATRL